MLQNLEPTRLPPALRLPEQSLSSFKRQLKTHMAVAALVCLLQMCLVTYIPSSGAVVTVVSSAPTTKVPTQLNSICHHR